MWCVAFLRDKGKRGVWRREVGAEARGTQRTLTFGNDHSSKEKCHQHNQECCSVGKNQCAADRADGSELRHRHHVGDVRYQQTEEEPAENHHQ